MSDNLQNPFLLMPTAAEAWAKDSPKVSSQ